MLASLVKPADILGNQTARIEVIPDGEEHPRWSEIVDFIAALGVVLDPWQLRVLWAGLLRANSLWAAFTVAVCAPRQNGKNGILEIRELVGACLLGEKLIIHTAHLADTSMEGFRRLDDLIDANEWLSKDIKHIRRQNGQEVIIFKNGCRIRFRTRTKGGGRGFSGSPVVFDEPMFLPEVSMASAMPVISAQPDPQLWYTGSAVDQATMSDGIVFARVRERALSGEHKRLVYFEWSLDYENPDEVPADLDLHEAAAATNPAYGIRISPEYIEAEDRELDARSRAVERFGVGDWPDTDGAKSIIDLALWDKLCDPASKPIDPVAFAFDVTPSRSSSSIIAVGRREDGLLHVERIDNRPGTGWVVGRLVELVASHKPFAIVCDERSPAASLIAELEQLGIEVMALDTAQHVQACGLFFDAVQQKTLRHRGQDDLKSAIKGASQRPLGDAWAWSRKNSATDISPLVAATLGVWAVSNEKPAELFVAFG